MFIEIPGFNNYLIDTDKWNDDICIYSIKSKKYVGTKTRYNHIMIGLYQNGKQAYFHLHRLIYTMFKGEIPEGYIVHHIDGNGFNNNPDNLCCMPLGKHISLHHTGLKMSEEHNIKLHKLLSKPVICSKDGVDLKEYPSCKSTEKDGFLFTSVNNCCRKIQKSHKGFQFRFKE